MCRCALRKDARFLSLLRCLLRIGQLQPA